MGSWQRDYVKNTLTWSDGMYLISELTQEEFNDNFDNYLNIVHPDDRELLLRTAQEAHSAQLPYDLEYRLIMPDAGIKWVHSRATASYDENGIPLIMTGIHRDITDRKQAEAELSRTKGLRNLIIDAVPAYISYVDRECRYQLVNRRYEELTGLSVKNIRGRLVRDILGEIAWAEASPYVDRVLAGEEVTYETKFTGVDGKLRTLQVFHTPDRGPDGEVLGSVVLVHDITEKKKTEQTLQSYSRRLIDLEEEVRKDLAAELHDELGPDLTALNFTLALINNDTTEPGGRLSLLMADATQLVDDMNGKVRNIIARLQPPVLSHHENAGGNAGRELPPENSPRQGNRDPSDLTQGGDPCRLTSSSPTIMPSYGSGSGKFWRHSQISSSPVKRRTVVRPLPSPERSSATSSSWISPCPE